MVRLSRLNSKKQRTKRIQRSLKKVRYGVPRKEKRIGRGAQQCPKQFVPPEDWYSDEVVSDSYRIIVQDAGPRFRHVVNPQEIIDRLSELPDWMLEPLSVVQLSQMTKKKLRLPCYGMQWGSALYLYPIEDELVEYFNRAPASNLVIETKMFGGKWVQDGERWQLRWTESTIRDFYLNNILIHELGHLLDERNGSYVDRERFAEWFAIQYGYLPTRDLSRKKSRKRIRRRHHAC